MSEQGRVAGGSSGRRADYRAGSPTWVRWRIVAILASFAFMNHFNRTCMAVADRDLKEEFGFSDQQMGTIYSAFLLAYIVCMTPGGWLADRWGSKRTLIFVGFATAFFMALTGLGGYGLLAAGLALPSFLVIRLLMGGCTSPLFPAAGRAVASWIPFPGRAWANGLILGATTLGVGLSHVVFGALLDSVGWRLAFMITGLFTAGLPCLWAWHSKDKPRDHPAVNEAELELIGTQTSSGPPVAAAAAPAPAAADGWLQMLKNRSLMLLTLNYFAVGYFEYMLFYWMESYFKDVRKLSVEDSRWYAMIVPLGMAITMPLGGWVSDRLVTAHGQRFGRSSVAIAGFLASAGCLFVATRIEDRYWMVTWFFLAHAAIGLCEAPIWVTALEVGRERCGTSAAIVNSGGNIGGLVAAQLTPLLGAWLGWQSGMGAGSVLCLLAIVLWLWIDPAGHDKRHAVTT